MEKKLIVGLDDTQKADAIKRYLENNQDVSNIVYFYPVGMKPQDLSWTGLPVEYRTFWDVIRYMFDTPLHEKVDNNYLLIYDEMMRVRKRTDLSYNACHHIANQTNHVLLFQWLPFINDPKDFMILIDFVFPWKWKMQNYDKEYIHLPEVEIHKQDFDFKVKEIRISKDAKIAYEEKKNELFENIGNKNPETLPRNLQLFAGNFKKGEISSNKMYMARNQRFKAKNVHTWKEYRLYDSMTQCAGSGESIHQGKVIIGTKMEEVYILDTPTSPVEFTDFLKLSGVRKINYITTGLSVDDYYCGECRKFFENLEEFYAD